jgi:hypothetical protein
VVGAITDGNTGWTNEYGLMSTITQNLTYMNLNYVNKSGELNDGRGCQWVSAKGTIDCTENWRKEAQPNIDAANITSGTILNARYNMTYLSDVANASDQQGHITNLWANASIQSAQQVALWGNASNQDGRLISVEGRALQPSIDGNNITAGTVPNARMNSSYVVPYTGANRYVDLGSHDIVAADMNATIFRMGTFCIRWLNATHVTQEPVCGV